MKHRTSLWNVQSKGSIVFVIAMLGALYSMTLASYLQPLNGFWSMDQGVKLLHILALIRSKLQSSAMGYPGQILDPEGQFMPLRGQFFLHQGRTYGMFSDAFAAMNVPFFFFFGYPGLYVLPVLSTLATLLVCWLLAGRLFTPKQALVSVLVCGLATPLWFYGQVFWEHAPATLLVLLALYLAISRRPMQLFLAGLLLGMAVWLRFELVLAILAVLAVLLLEGQRNAMYQAGCLAAGALLGGIPLMLYNQWVFDHVLGPHVLVHMIASKQLPSPTYIERFYSYVNWITLLIVPTSQPILLIGVIGLLVYALGRQLRILGSSYWLMAGLLLAYTLGIMLYHREQFQPALVISAPLVMLAMLPTDKQGRHHQEAMIACIWRFSLLFALLCWIMKLPDGGAQWGPRMLLPIIPLLTLLGLRRAIDYYEQSPMRWMRLMVCALTLLLIVYGIRSELDGLYQIQAFNSSNRKLLATVAQSGERVIVTDESFVPSLLAQIYYEDRLIYFVEAGDDLDSCIAMLKAHEIHSFYFVHAHFKRLFSESTVLKTLDPQAKAVRLPHNLWGQRYQIP